MNPNDLPRPEKQVTVPLQLIEDVLSQEFVSTHPMDVMHRTMLRQAVDEFLYEESE